MCNNTTTNTSPHLQTTNSMIKKQPASPPKAKAKSDSRRTRIRTRTRKPKYLSLKMELSPGDMSVPRPPQLNLFPLHPENLMEEKEENVDHLLDSGDGATLNGLLDAPESESSLSPAYGYGGGEGEEASKLVRTAMKRSEERRVGEEKWVRYSEVVEKREEEVSSCSASAPSWWCTVKTTPRSLSLKLDYQEILDAWSDKGSLYIGHQGGDHCPQTVPDLRDDDFFGAAANNNGVMDSWGSVGNLWTVPENSCSIRSSVKGDEGGGKDGGSKLGQREASMLRYKEKRQNRLFSKRIRYEVRKLNAEKRPRMKGRFVKRN